MKRLALLALFAANLAWASAPVVIDVRTPGEYQAGHLPGALNLEYQSIAQQISRVAPKKDTPIVLYCRSGRRSGIAQDTLRELGYTNVTNGGSLEAMKARTGS